MDENDSRTLYIGNLAPETTEDIIFELFVQAGPLDHVKRPIDKQSNILKPFAFVCYKHECSIPYALYLLDGIMLNERPLKVQTRRNSQVIPPMHAVGIHSLDPDFGNTCTNQEPYNRSKNPAQLDSYNGSMVQHHMPFMMPMSNALSSRLGFPPPPPPSIDTNSLNNFKNMMENSGPSFARFNYPDYGNPNYNSNLNVKSMDQISYNEGHEYSQGNRHRDSYNSGKQGRYDRSSRNDSPHSVRDHISNNDYNSRNNYQDNHSRHHSNNKNYSYDNNGHHSNSGDPNRNDRTNYYNDSKSPQHRHGNDHHSRDNRHSSQQRYYESRY